uniref:Enoyl reductase (ER) domain-containing protein n=1 Tax=Kalanchoe fedtschenkoi TaxID=63787 RepID=A0A7N0TMJ5_KALFE
MATEGSQETAREVAAFGWAAKDSSGHLSPFHFSRRPTRDTDVKIKVLYCGICHSDLHLIKNDWGISWYPLVPGHEMVGVVAEVGSGVKGLKVGDKAGVGYYCNSCQTCEDCENGLESYCPEMITTVCGKDKDGTTTYGGFSDIMVVEERYAVRIPDNLDLAGAGPLLCAGITVYSPLKYYGLTKPGMHIGVVGLGGLGHVAVKFAKAFGARVTVISTSAGKKEEALERLGADAFLVSRDPEQMKAAIGTMDGIIDTVAAVHPIAPYLNILKRHGKLVIVSAPNKPLELHVAQLTLGRKLVGGSCTGGIKETQEMLEFAAKNGIMADVEVIPMDYVNTALERLAKSDVRYRFVIDIGNTLEPTTTS